MPRLKFAAFAVVALGLWAYHLSVVSPTLSSMAVEQATASLVGAPASVALRIEAQRSALQAAVARVGTSPVVWTTPSKAPKPEAPSADRFNAVRAAVSDALPEALRGQVFIAVTNDVGTLSATGAADPVAELPEGLDVGPAVQAGAQGSLATVAKASLLLYAVPQLVADKGEVKPAGAVLIGLPVLPEPKGLVEGVLKDLQLEAVGVVSKGVLLAAAGSNKAALEHAVKGLKPGAVTAVSEGPVDALGPLALPMMTQSSAWELGLRRELAGTPFEVIAIASARPALEQLAGYQKFGLLALVGLALLAGVVALLLGGHEEEGARMVLPPPVQVPPMASRPPEPVAAAPLPMAESHAAPEAHPDDFDFPNTTPAPTSRPPPPPAPPMPREEPEEDPFASVAPAPAPGYPSSSSGTAQTPAFQPAAVTGQTPAFQPASVTGQSPAYQTAPAAPLPAPVAAPPPPAPMPAPAPAPSARGSTPSQVSRPPPPLMDDEEVGGRTVAYPAFKPGMVAQPAPLSAPPPPPAPSAPPMDPFALATAQLSDDEAHQNEDFNPDATRVAAVPQELIKAARTGTGNTTERPAMKPSLAAMPKVQSVAPVAVSEEDKHFQDVFRDFVSTREKCGEPADGLTFDKFKAKLLKNKEQLVQKYNCRTVRFQVYVKDGKAALKASPVKDA
jgi:hypothetical protein